MINKSYRQSALVTYGESCELCGHRTSLEVHHIDYKEHQEIEDLLRYQLKYDTMTFRETMDEAKKLGYDVFNSGDKQLSKNDDTKNLSVLCGNCHSLCHLIDYGKNLLKALKSRR
jgi:hypothetical protein